MTQEDRMETKARVARKKRPGSQTESVEEARTRLGVTAATVRGFMEKGILRGFRTGHGWRVNSASVDELLNGTGGSRP
jgi:excisionase family DNA binding protein